MKQTKLLIILLCIFILLQTAQSQEMCSDTVEPLQPCLFVTPTINCSIMNYQIINLTGTIIETSNLINLNNSIYYLNFNQTEGYYVIRLCDGTTREVYVQPPEEGKMFFTIGLILLPILIGFLLMYSSTTLSEEHNVVKMFLFILGLATPIISYQYSMELISTQSTLALLSTSTGVHSSVFSWTFYVVLIYFIIFSVINLIKYLAEKKKEELEY